MGKWASAKKHGSQGAFGQFAGPLVAGFSLGVVTATTIPVNRAASYPPGVDRWGVMAVNTLTGAISFENITTLAALTATGLVSGQTYRVYVYWSANLARVSELVLLATQTTP